MTGDKKIKKNSIVGRYTGDVLTAKELALRYPPVNGTISENSYLFELVENARFIDAADPDSPNVNWTRYINHSSDSPNLEIELNPSQDLVWFTALRDIEVGEEFVFDYGERYWDGCEEMIV